jgi:hypothetical protein
LRTEAGEVIKLIRNASVLSFRLKSGMYQHKIGARNVGDFLLYFLFENIPGFICFSKGLFRDFEDPKAISSLPC